MNDFDSLRLLFGAHLIRFCAKVVKFFESNKSNVNLFRFRFSKFLYLFKVASASFVEGRWWVERKNFFLSLSLACNVF